MVSRAPAEAVEDGMAYSSVANSWAHGWVAWREATWAPPGVPILTADGETEITSLTTSPVLIDGRRYKITASVRFNPAQANESFLALYAGATQIDSCPFHTLGVNKEARWNVCGLYLATADGPVTFKVQAKVVTAAAQINLTNIATTPALILVEDIGNT